MSAKLKEFQIRRLFLPKFSQLKNIDEAAEELKKGLFNDGLEAIFWNIGNLNNKGDMTKIDGELALKKAILTSLYNFDWLSLSLFDKIKFRELMEYAEGISKRHSSPNFNLTVNVEPSFPYFLDYTTENYCPNIILFSRAI